MRIPNLAIKPLRGVGEFYAMALDTLVAIPRRPFAWREFWLQCWFVARVSVCPLCCSQCRLRCSPRSPSTSSCWILAQQTPPVPVPASRWRNLVPIVTVLVVAGAGATAMCADLGARTIRDELDALRVMGINPIQTLVVPRVLAASLWRCCFPRS